MSKNYNTKKPSKQMSLKKRLDDAQDKSLDLDSVTPVFLSFMGLLNPKTQAIVDFMVRRGEYVSSGDISKKLRDMHTASVSVYLRKLVEIGFINKKPINKKDFVYKIDNKLFVNWYQYRYLNKMRGGLDE